MVFLFCSVDMVNNFFFFLSVEATFDSWGQPTWS